MNVSEAQLDLIVDRIVKKMESAEAPAPKKVEAREDAPLKTTMLGSFLTIDDAIAASLFAFKEYQQTPVAVRKKIIENIRKHCRESVNMISKLAVEETGLGRYEDKIVKNLCAIDKTPGVEDLEPIAFTGDHGLTLLERAPFGVIGSITPTTNPSETIINNGIGMIAGGNVVCFNPHPSAKKTSAMTIDILNRASISAGGPPNLFTTVVSPTIESAQKLMTHPKVSLLVVTGGPAVVSAAMKSGKRVIAAGPGNPPVVVDDTADLDRAGRDIVMSASTDNNIICVIEKEIIVTEKSSEKLKESLVKHGAVMLSPYQTKRLELLVLTADHHVKKEWVGKDVQVILKAIGIDVPAHKRLAIMDTGPDHPFATHELLMPIVPVITVKNIDEAIELAYKLEGGCFHTAVIHSKNIDNMDRMAKKMNTSIFIKNGPALAGLGLGGEGPGSFTIASPTGEGVTTARHFTRTRRCVLTDYFRIV